MGFPTRRWIAVSILELLATAAAAPIGAQPSGTLEVHLRRGAGVTLGDELEVLLEPSDGERVPAALSAAGLQRIEVQGSFAGRVGCRSERLWCPWRTVSTQDATVVVPVFRAGRTAGRVVPTREGAPEDLLVEGTVDVPGLGAVPFQQAVAVGEDGRFDLALPQAELDLRFTAAEWAPLYRWSLEVGDGTTDLGGLRFFRGSSVSGFVREAATELPAAGAAVSALPASAGELDEAARARLEALAGTAATDRWGFFQLAGLPPGRYRLRIEKDGFYPARSPLVEVIADSETRLGDAVDLLPAVRVSLAISPRQPREEEGWQVRLVGRQGREELREAVADEAGMATFERLPPGTYRVLVRSERHPAVWHEEMELTSDGTIAIDLPLVRISGEVTLDDEPLAARITLGTGARDTWRYRSDEEGRFGGAIRRPEHDIVFVRVEADEPEIVKELEVRRPSVEDDVLELRLALEDRVVEGTVVDRFGEPVGDAVVRVFEGSKVVAEVRTDAAGEFAARALDRGRYQVSARAPGRGSTEVVDADLSASRRAGPFRLTLVAQHRVEGSVRTADGRPVQGARVEALTWSPVQHWAPATTDLAGRFALDLPEEARRVHLEIVAPSLGLAALCATLPSEDAALDVELPAAADAALVLDVESSPELPPATTDALGLLRREGGVLDLSEIGRWARAQGGDPEDGETAVHGLFPGHYALAWLDGPSWYRAAVACEPALAPGRRWQYVGPGETVRLRYDLAPHQRAAAGLDPDGSR